MDKYDDNYGTRDDDKINESEMKQTHLKEQVTHEVGAIKCVSG